MAQTLSSAGYATPGGVPGWGEGSVLTLIAAGGALSGWEASATIPAAPTFTSPDVTKLAPEALTIGRDRKFDLQWTPTTGEVFALILQLDADIVAVRGIQCFYAATDGSASIPAAALAHLLPSASVHHTNLYLSADVHTRIARTGVDVEIAVWNGNAQKIVVE